MNQGKHVIAVMLLIGVAAAGISLWHHYNVSRRAHRVLGPGRGEADLSRRR